MTARLLLAGSTAPMFFESACSAGHRISSREMRYATHACTVLALHNLYSIISPRPCYCTTAHTDPPFPSHKPALAPLPTVQVICCPFPILDVIPLFSSSLFAAPFPFSDIMPSIPVLCAVPSPIPVFAHRPLTRSYPLDSPPSSPSAAGRKINSASLPRLCARITQL